MSCQNYSAQKATLAINATANHTYNLAGIRVNTPGYVYTSSAGFKKSAAGFIYLGVISPTTAAQGTLSSTTSTPPTITTQPRSQTVTAGQTATFRVTATGTAPLSYQCSKNNINIGGATSPSYTTPVTTADNGSSFKVKASNSVGSVISNSAILTVMSIRLTATPSINKEVGIAYSQVNTVSGGVAPYVYSISLGAVPSGTTLNTATGTVSGTPTSAGAFSYTVKVTDNNGAMATASSSGTIAGSVGLTATPSANTEVGVVYSQVNTVSGGVAPYVYSISAGAVPVGTTLNTATGTVSGNPTTAGAFSYTVTVTDDDGATATASSSGTITTVTFYVGTDLGNIMVSTNAGVSWIATTSQPDGSGVNSVFVSGSTLYAGTSLGDVMVSTDAGANWTATPAQPDGGAGVVRSVSVNGSKLYGLRKKMLIKHLSVWWWNLMYFSGGCVKLVSKQRTVR